ncbi:GNAT family N-acetyltransferase [Actinoplanes sp. TBRC 11911]|uniref:GNAT family N-acetyltransferase n=1 Tax=Actinoplanes sp. TBRC 11911 TaxID=2729386 RepID=UPI00145CA492|nr:GNAT family N-acetyltransferase [Actinoplanes sp. TBRC 11911]NMO55357.1 GNAT family N-acetyltransferase [Actinoplanes sp. TBRC 11911]
MKIDFADSGDDPALIASLVNRVYDEAEKGLWLDGAKRTDVMEVSGSLQNRELVVARLDANIVGVVRIRRLTDELGEFGMLAVDPVHRGIGVGRDLVAFVERWARGQGLLQMQLELLVPSSWSHPTKEFLRSWYVRIGYQQVRTARLEETYPALQPLLATPCDYLIYHKDLTKLS